MHDHRVASNWGSRWQRLGKRRTQVGQVTNIATPYPFIVHEQKYHSLEANQTRVHECSDGCDSGKNVNAQSGSTTGGVGAVSRWDAYDTRVGASCVVQTGTGGVDARGISDAGSDKTCSSGIPEWRKAVEGISTSGSTKHCREIKVLTELLRFPLLLPERSLPLNPKYAEENRNCQISPI
jgi:hypothetical protein